MIHFAFELFIEAFVLSMFIAVTALWCGLLTGVL